MAVGGRMVIGFAVRVLGDLSPSRYRTVRILIRNGRCPQPLRDVPGVRKHPVLLVRRPAEFPRFVRVCREEMHMVSLSHGVPAVLVRAATDLCPFRGRTRRQHEAEISTDREGLQFRAVFDD